MARKAAGWDTVPPNVISLAQARAARRAPFEWPADGPHAEAVAVAALHAAAGEAALVAADGTILAVNRDWLLATPAAGPGADVFATWLHRLDPRDTAPLITGLRSALGGTDGYVHDLELDGQLLRVAATSLGGSVGGAVLTVSARDPRTIPAPGRDRLTGLADRERFVDHLDRARRADDTRALAVLVVAVRDLELVDLAEADRLVVEVARRLSAVTADDDVVARLGRDELALLARRHPADGDARTLATAVAEQLAAPFLVGERPVRIDTTVGLCIEGRRRTRTSEAILRDAVAASRDARELTLEHHQFPTSGHRGFVPVATSQITDGRADQPSMETQEGHRHE